MTFVCMVDRRRRDGDIRPTGKLRVVVAGERRKALRREESEVVVEEGQGRGDCIIIVGSMEHCLLC